MRVDLNKEDMATFIQRHMDEISGTGDSQGLIEKYNEAITNLYNGREESELSSDEIAELTRLNDYIGELHYRQAELETMKERLAELQTADAKTAESDRITRITEKARAYKMGKKLKEDAVAVTIPSNSKMKGKVQQRNVEGITGITKVMVGISGPVEISGERDELLKQALTLEAVLNSDPKEISPDEQVVARKMLIMIKTKLEKEYSKEDKVVKKDEKAKTPESGTPVVDTPESGEPQNSEPQNGEPQNSEPQNSEPQNSEPQNSEPQNGEPQNGEPKNEVPNEVQAGFKIGPFKKILLKIVRFFKNLSKEGGRLNKFWSNAEGNLIGSGAEVALDVPEDERTAKPEKNPDKKIDKEVEQLDPVDILAKDGMNWIDLQPDRDNITNMKKFFERAKKSMEYNFGKKSQPTDSIRQNVEREAGELDLPKLNQTRYDDVVLYYTSQEILKEAKREGIPFEKDGQARKFEEIWAELDQKLTIRQKTDRVSENAGKAQDESDKKADPKTVDPKVADPKEDGR